MTSPQMYKVRVLRIVWTADAPTVDSWRAHLPSDAPKAPRVAHLAFDIELPFTPYPGLSIGRDSWESGPLRKVHWEDADQRFICVVEEVYTEGGADFRARIDEDHAAGWTRVGGDAPGWVRGIVEGEDEYERFG